MSVSDAIPHPNVRVPPPLIYVAGFFVGWLIDRRWPLPMMGPEHHVVRVVIGVAFLLLSLMLIGAAFATFRGAKTAIIPLFPAST